jgi:plastocyanin
MSWRKYLAVLSPGVLVMALALAFMFAASAENADAAQYTVNIRDFNFNPTTLTVQVGDVVRWENNGTTAHTTSSTSGPSPWDSGNLAPGAAFTQQFTTPGTYQYVCRIHSNMMGSIVVQGPPTPTPAPAAPTATSAPAATVVVSPTPGPTAAPTAVPQPTVIVVQPPTPPEVWILVLDDTPAFTLTDDFAWIALPGEWYQVVDVDSGWALARWEFDPPSSIVWILIDDRVDLGLY